MRSLTSMGTDRIVNAGTGRAEAGDLPSETLGAVEALARAHLCDLRADALKRARLLFVETPKALSRRLAGQWVLAA